MVMKYKIELELPEKKLALAIEFIRNLPFVKNVKTISPIDKSNNSLSQNLRPFGILKGSINVPDNFTEPLDDLKDYM